ncbi:hypothetical protein BU25DRAFT_409097 [Macroventuria anomochaeta]|uniref:Uncharacterized protein n=1 Tax=Macroventuria anomochaeta TaxID=301207 RepID=A0ACB6S708_9PLEO|nr:uncharacterized protein BU25DRAFT_409097 [Macroventuria anomochaeta]KAF2629839.1 hypothetical protein BU25DRAFT_409097 [Macroventuria anomochaeta]
MTLHTLDYITRLLTFNQRLSHHQAKHTRSIFNFTLSTYSLALDSAPIISLVFDRVYGWFS